MSVDFQLIDFFQPMAVLKFRNLLERAQWWDPPKIKAYQDERLVKIISHAYKNVPYYREIFDSCKLTPKDITSVSDLAKLPLLSKKMVQSRGSLLAASNKNKFSPRVHSTSGSSGQKLEFLLDRATNALEFAYYWRHWNWAGYRLGDPFCEFSSTFFLKRECLRNQLGFRQWGTGRFLLNSLSLSRDNVPLLADLIWKYKAKFLKGLPSVLYFFSYFLRERGISARPLKAVFCTGETLFPHQRQLIEKTFGCKVFNSYGHMERVVAICECSEGGMHVNEDYGLMEFVDRQPLPASNLTGEAAGPLFRAKVVGTSLYNFSMPFIRYEVGDAVVVEEKIGPCQCGRSLPLVRGVEGREEDVIVTPDGKIVPTLFLVFEEIPGILLGQIIQEDLNTLIVRIVKGASFQPGTEEHLISHIRKHVGNMMKVEIHFVKEDEVWPSPGIKNKVINSKLPSPYSL